MDEKRYELVEIQVDAELLEQLEAVIAPMGLTPEMLAVKFFEFCVDPAMREWMKEYTDQLPEYNYLLDELLG